MAAQFHKMLQAERVIDSVGNYYYIWAALGASKYQASPLTVKWIVSGDCQIHSF
jgi:hypothetical protein